MVANLVLLGYVVYDDPFSLVWCGALLGLGFLLMALQVLTAKRHGVEVGGRGRAGTS